MNQIVLAIGLAIVAGALSAVMGWVGVSTAFYIFQRGIPFPGSRRRTYLEYLRLRQFS